MLKTLPILFLLLAGGLALAACGSKSPPPQEQAPTALGEQTAPAPVPESTPPICLYLFWSRDSSLVAQLQERLGGGEKFPLAAHEVSQGGLEGASRLNATCVASDKLDPLLRQQAQELSVGQVSPPFEYAKGQALIMRTTDQYWQQGRELFSQEKYAEAAAAFRRHLELHPDAAAVWQALADCLAAQGEDAQALEALDKALAITPENPSLLNDRGTVLMRLGRGEEGVASYRQALLLAPGNPLLMHNMAWALLQQGEQLRLAQTLAEQAVRVNPNNPRFWDTLGRIQKARGELGDAVVSLHRAHYLGANQKGTSEDMINALLELPPEVVARLAGHNAPSVPAPPLAKAAAPAKQASSGPVSLGPLAAPAEQSAHLGASSLSPQWRAPAQEASPPPEPPAPAPEAAPDDQSEGRAPAPAPAPKAAAPPGKQPPVSPPPPPEPAPSAPEQDEAKLAAPPPVIPGYYVLVGSFRTSDLAAKEMKRWRKRQQAVWMEWKQVPGKGAWVRVLLGPYQKEADARAEARSWVKQKIIYDYRVLSKGE